MPSEIAIRPVSESDLEGWLPLWQGYNAFYGRSGDTALPEAVTAATWARFFDEREPVHGLVAELEGALVGLAHYLFHRNTIMIAPTCYLQDLFTAPACRGRGVARRLMEGFYAQARAAGAHSVYWHTHETNAAARALYDKLATNTHFFVYRASL